LPSWVVQWVDAERNPQSLVYGKCEAFRHNSDDGPPRRPQFHRFADDVGITAETHFPKTLPNHYNRRRIRLFVRIVDRPAEQRCNPRDAKCSRTDFHDLDGLRRPAAYRRVAEVNSEGGELLYGFQ